MWVGLILLVGFFAWYFRSPQKPPVAAPRFRYDPRLHDSTPDWRRIVKEHAESPAETAFCEAMIDAYQLAPKLGSLLGKDLKLDFQVEEGRYRVDFLANGWLVIEIDGAAWHSSPEAQARDQRRDAYFESLGYTVLRIPAKVVFESPQEAVQRVRSALAVGKRALPEPEPTDGSRSIGQAVASLSSSLDQMNQFVRRSQYVDKALVQSKLALEQEKSVLNAAISIAQRKLSIEEMLNDKKLRTYYNESYSNMLEKMGLSVIDEICETNPFVENFVFAMPDGVNPEMETYVQNSFSLLKRERGRIFADAADAIQNEPRLGEHIFNYLREFGREDLWLELGCPTPPIPYK